MARVFDPRQILSPKKDAPAEDEQGKSKKRKLDSEHYTNGGAADPELVAVNSVRQNDLTLLEILTVFLILLIDDARLDGRTEEGIFGVHRHNSFH